MARTYTQLLNHIVFSTKERRPLMSPDLRARLFPYMGGITRQLGGVPILINGVADHVHLLASPPVTTSLSDFVGKLKANSARWVHETIPEHRIFGWQAGYSAFTVSMSQRQGVLDYIARQEEHHRKATFEEELVVFLKKHQIQYDERYLFD